MQSLCAYEQDITVHLKLQQLHDIWLVSFQNDATASDMMGSHEFGKRNQA